MNGLLRKSRIKLAELIIILSLLNQALSINSNITKSGNKLIIDLEYNDKQIFYANLLIGSSHQKINFIFSTFSELSMITSEECKDCVYVKNNTNSNNYEKLVSKYLKQEPVSIKEQITLTKKGLIKQQLI
jgi:hypothetical protein